MTFNNKTISELHALLVSKEISATELTAATFEDIRSRESQVDAFLKLTEDQALVHATEIDASGIDVGNVLSGIPIAIKDNIVTKNVETTASSKILTGWIPPYDATVIEKLKSAGAILVGKTNMDEFAMGGSGENSSVKPTKNAWDLTKVPGGSSSGSASSVASGEVRLSLGSDTGGSIRQPASFSGIVGVKPTYGRVSRFGLIAFGSSFDQIGPFAPTVRESAQVLTAISGFDKKDATTTDATVPDFTSKIGQSINGMKIGIAKEHMGPGVDPEVKSQILAAASILEQQGAIIEEVSLPHSEYGVAVYYIVASSEASSNLQRFDGIRFGYRAEGATSLDDIYVKSRSEGFGEEVKRRIMLGTYSLSAGYYDAYFKKAGQVRTLIIEDFNKVFSDHDLILGPTAPTPAYKLGALNHDPITMYQGDMLTIPVNLAGLPAISVPAGFVNEMPIGMQLIGKRNDEETIYQVAAAFEGATNFHNEKPTIFGKEA
ncbi:Asp-tRNA(Asn)/Glu-tRNA(Gln) amidotransferase subunit GatA [Lactovum miscens]|uniref:Glutamyl-tRNA(Gln) amidotransferase subunit A n=1 Tax=Lactovum miscens TaxID=190387 RepID=A0A841C814_9LACT|nr:Asp-tRNA(Asn)/Glu-tRNA(Gln) amidotransferase subunit GatA [Lactovum miscens]MBB5887380.1 aspartyl-tRNA(Asn)/glutamyl-tRNA(Gln) amidotransferase subunit A [Lactovum miscens]